MSGKEHRVPLVAAAQRPSRLRGVSAPRGDFFANIPRAIARWFYATGRGRRLTVATFALPIALAIVLPLLGPIDFDFVPQVQTGEIDMTVTYPPGTPLQVTAKYVTALEDGIMKIDGIKSVSSTVGRKPQGWSSAIGDNYARLNAQTLPERRHDTYKIIDEIRKLGYLVPGGDFQVAGDNGGGSGTPIFYSLSGPEGEIGPAAEKIAQFLREHARQRQRADEQRGRGAAPQCQHRCGRRPRCSVSIQPTLRMPRASR